MAEKTPEENAPDKAPKAKAGEPDQTQVPNYLQDLPVQIDVVLASLKMPVRELMACGPGSVIDIGKKVTDPFDLYVNNVLVARGEIVMMHDHIGLKIVEVIDRGVHAQGVR